MKPPTKTGPVFPGVIDGTAAILTLVRLCRRWVPLSERPDLDAIQRQAQAPYHLFADRWSEVKNLLVAAEEAADWLCDTPPGSDQCDRGRRLLAALEMVKGGGK